MADANERSACAQTPALPDTINRRWSLDFVSDALSDGRRFRIFCVVDDFSRECLATVVDTSIGCVRVVRELERSVTERGGPSVIVIDNGCELTSMAVLRWSMGRLDWHYIAPGQISLCCNSIGPRCLWKRTAESRYRIASATFSCCSCCAC